MYRYLADVVMIVHFGFILFVALGGIVAWRWRKVIWLHLAAVAWGIGIVWAGFDCPLTPLERNLRNRGGEQGYDEGWGFVDAYIEGVVYPEEYTPLLRALAAGLIAVGWAGYLWRRRRLQADRDPDPVRDGDSGRATVSEPGTMRGR